MAKKKQDQTNDKQKAIAKAQKRRPASRLNKDQYEQLRPYFPTLKQFRDHGSYAGGDTGITLMDQISQQYGDKPTDLWCSGCTKELLKTIVAEIENYDITTFDPQM